MDDGDAALLTKGISNNRQAHTSIRPRLIEPPHRATLEPGLQTHPETPMTPIDRRRFVQGGLLTAAGTALGPAAALACEDVSSEFGRRSTADDVTAGLDLSGKTALVTGCNSGIGYETMRTLALRGAHVLGTARTLERGQEACASVEGRATPLVLELTEFETAVQCAQQVRAMGAPLDILICNAGAIFDELWHVNGVEAHFVTNHLGHFVLVNQLLDLVVAAPQGRVVIVGSRAHENAPDDGIQFDDLAGESWFATQRAYGHSKLANGLHALELARRLEGTRATANVVHPGVVRTNIARNLPAWQELAFRVAGYLFLKSSAQGAATTCYAATNPDLQDVSGCYFADCNPETPSANMQDADMAARLWEVSEELTRDFAA